MLLFTLGASLLTGIVFGIAPALQGSSAGLGEALNEGSRGASGRRGKRVRSLLVVTEFALALVLLVGAGLLVRTLWRLQKVDVGFQPKNVTTASLWLPQPDIRENGRYNESSAQAAFYRKALERIRALPGVGGRRRDERPVQHPSVHDAAPDRGTRPRARRDRRGRRLERFDGLLPDPRHSPQGRARLRRARRRGRRAGHDRQRDPSRDRFFPGEDAIGKRLRFPGRPLQRQVVNGDKPAPWMTIVGVVGDVKTESLTLDGRPAFYRPLLQASNALFTFVIRGASPPSTLGPQIDAAVRSLDTELPVFAVRTMSEAMAATVEERRFAMQLLALFAAAALALSAVGIYGVIAYGVAQRTREIGIRMALGARPADVRRMLLLEGGKLAGAGVAIGLAGSVLLTRAMSALLYEVGPRDPMTLVSVPAVLAGVALAATFFPARRASRVDPTTALRSE